MRRFQFTFFLVLASVIATGVAAAAVNGLAGGVAANNLERLARQSLPMEALLSGSLPVDASSPSLGAEKLLSLEGDLPTGHLTSAGGLELVELNVVGMQGKVVWSTDPEVVGAYPRRSRLYRHAVDGWVAAKLVERREPVDSVGLLETYVPMRENPWGPVVGVVEVSREVGADVALQAGSGRSRALKNAVAMSAGGLVVMLGSIVVADLAVYRRRPSSKAPRRRSPGLPRYAASEPAGE